jgi:hypothetical protein
MSTNKQLFFTSVSHTRAPSTRSGLICTLEHIQLHFGALRLIRLLLHVKKFNLLLPVHNLRKRLKVLLIIRLDRRSRRDAAAFNHPPSSSLLSSEIGLGVEGGCSPAEIGVQQIQIDDFGEDCVALLWGDPKLPYEGGGGVCTHDFCLADGVNERGYHLPKDIKYTGGVHWYRAVQPL